MSYYLVLSRLMLKSKAWLWFSFIYKILIKEIIIIPKQLVLKRIKCNNTTGVTTLIQLKEHLLPCKTTKDYEGQSVILGEQSVTLGNQLAILGDTLSDCCPARFHSRTEVLLSCTKKYAYFSANCRIVPCCLLKSNINGV